MKKKVAIIGSGIAGLTLGNLLQNNSNFEFVIYEKNETLNFDEGFGENDEFELQADAIIDFSEGNPFGQP